MTTMSFHVYAEDGFETAHRTLQAATRAARRGWHLRRVPYRVVRADARGLTGGGCGVVVYATTDLAGGRDIARAEYDV